MMTTGTSYYCVARYVPDPVRDEGINFGVFAFGTSGGGEDTVKFLSISNWARLRKFGGENIDFLKEFSESAKRMRADEIRHMAEKWRNSIQLSEPRAATLPPDDLLPAIVKRFLVDIGPAELGYRRKEDIVRVVRRDIGEALLTQIGSYARAYLKTSHEIQGKRGKHTFDLGVGNGRPYFLAQAISFEISDRRQIGKQVDATAWAVEDIAPKENGPPVGVVILPPKSADDGEQRELHQNAIAIFTDLGAQVVKEDSIREWAGRMVSEHVPAA